MKIRINFFPVTLFLTNLHSVRESSESFYKSLNSEDL